MLKSRLLPALLIVLFPLSGWAAGECGHIGRMLVASSEIPDEQFRASVVLLLSRGESGARGLVINRPGARVALADLARGCGLETGDQGQRPITVHFGGSQLPRAARVLHSAEFKGRTSCAMDERISVSRGCEVLAALLEGGEPEHYLILRGMMSWEPGQLAREMEQGWWREIPLDTSLLLEAPDVIKWHWARRMLNESATPSPR